MHLRIFKCIVIFNQDQITSLSDEIEASLFLVSFTLLWSKIIDWFYATEFTAFSLEWARIFICMQVQIIIIISVQVHTRFHMKLHNKIFLVWFLPLVTGECTISPSFHFINNLQWPEPKIYHLGVKFILLGWEKNFFRDFWKWSGADGEERSWDIGESVWEGERAKEGARTNENRRIREVDNKLKFETLGLGGGASAPPSLHP